MNCLENNSDKEDIQTRKRSKLINLFRHIKNSKEIISKFNDDIIDDLIYLINKSDITYVKINLDYKNQYIKSIIDKLDDIYIYYKNNNKGFVFNII